MGTPYSDIYALFLQQVTDQSLGNMLPADMNYHMSRWLMSASTKFALDCRQDILSRDSSSQAFTVVLTDLEQQILAQLMVVEWLSPALYTAQLLRQVISDKDFKVHSQANHIEQLAKLRNYAQDEAESLIMRYSYMSGLGNLR